MNQRQTIDISMRAILKVVGVLLGLWFLWAISDIVLLLFFVIIVVMALTPIIDKWQKHMSRPLAVSLLFVLLLAIVSLIIGILLPPLIRQSTDLANSLPNYVQELERFLASSSTASGQNFADQALQGISDQISNLSRSLVNTTLGLLNGIFTFLTVTALSVYLLIEEQGIKKFIISLLPHERKESIANAINKVGDKLGAWLRSQLILMAIIGSITMLWTSVLGLPYALPLGLWAGLTEVIPYVGPVLGGIPVVLIALADSPLKALVAVVIIILVQQIESHFIVPKVMEKSVGLSPIIVITALLIGGKLFGIVGTILAVPVAATIAVIIQEWPNLSKVIEKGAR